MRKAAVEHCENGTALFKEIADVMDIAGDVIHIGLAAPGPKDVGDARPNPPAFVRRDCDSGLYPPWKISTYDFKVAFEAVDTLSDPALQVDYSHASLAILSSVEPVGRVPALAGWVGVTVNSNLVECSLKNCDFGRGTMRT